VVPLDTNAGPIQATEHSRYGEVKEQMRSAMHQTLDNPAGFMEDTIGSSASPLRPTQGRHFSSRELSESLNGRLGYTYNQNPMSAAATLAVPTPLYYEHQLHTGTSYQLSESVSLNIAWIYLVEPEISAPPSPLLASFLALR